MSVSFSDITIRDLRSKHKIYFEKGNDSFLNIMGREFYLAPYPDAQHFMIETAVPWGREQTRKQVYTLKAFSPDHSSIITIGSYEVEKDALNIMSWLRANKALIKTYADVEPLKQSLSDIFAKPIF